MKSVIILEMFAIIINIYVFLLIRKTDELFVDLGQYLEYNTFDINLPECGLKALGKVEYISYNKMCFFKPYPNKMVALNINTNEEVSARIWKGRGSSVGESPWTVFIDIGRQYMCSGVLATFEWVLTAAHCVDMINSTEDLVTVYAGSNQKWVGEQRNIIKGQMFRHPFYVDPSSAKQSINVKAANDIGLIRLQDKFSRHLNDGALYLINTVCLPKAGPLNDNEEYATMTGWGDTDERGSLPNVLQIAESHLSPYQKCPANLISILCSFQNITQPRACFGDSGGPLVQYTDSEPFRAVLVGTFHGYGVDDRARGNCGPFPARGYWVAVMRVIPWILDTISQN